MKTANTWMESLGAGKQHFGRISRLQIREIQIDALKYAASLAKNDEIYHEKDTSISSFINDAVDELGRITSPICESNSSSRDRRTLRHD